MILIIKYWFDGNDAIKAFTHWMKKKRIIFELQLRHGILLSHTPLLCFFCFVFRIEKKSVRDHFLTAACSELLCETDVGSPQQHQH